MSNTLRSAFGSLLTSAFFILTLTTTSFAGVYFITQGRSITSPNYQNKECVAIGYSLTQCVGNRTPANICPKDDGFFKYCVCDPNVFKFDMYNCPYPMALSGESCDGKFQSCGCDVSFKYNTDNCSSPKKLTGLSCKDKFETCSCPYEYYKTCSGATVGDGDSCNGKYKSCKCASIYKTCSDGPDEGASVCTEENGTIKYSKCYGNSCENGGYSNYVPENFKCSEVPYMGRTCYTDCKPVTCFDGGYYDRSPSRTIGCPVVEFAKNTCYDCDKLCGYCDKFSGKCKLDCKNDCKRGMWFENKINGGFICEK